MSDYDTVPDRQDTKPPTGFSWISPKSEPIGVLSPLECYRGHRLRPSVSKTPSVCQSHPVYRWLRFPFETPRFVYFRISRLSESTMLKSYTISGVIFFSILRLAVCSAIIRS